jgi:hypothetical protein
MLMITRLISPRRSAVSLAAMTRICHFVPNEYVE